MTIGCSFRWRISWRCCCKSCQAKPLITPTLTCSLLFMLSVSGHAHVCTLQSQRGHIYMSGPFFFFFLCVCAYVYVPLVSYWDIFRASCLWYVGAHKVPRNAWHVFPFEGSMNIDCILIFELPREHNAVGGCEARNETHHWICVGWTMLVRWDEVAFWERVSRKTVRIEAQTTDFLVHTRGTA